MVKWFEIYYSRLEGSNKTETVFHTIFYPNIMSKNGQTHFRNFVTSVSDHLGCYA